MNPGRHLPLLLAALCPPALPAQVAVEREVLAMGTALRVVAVAGSRADALAAGELAVRAVDEVERRLSSWREDSDVSRIGAAPPGVAVAVAVETIADLGFAFAVADRTGGAFDPGIGALVTAFDLHGVGRNPTARERAAALAATGRGHFACTATTVARDCAAAGLDLGACGKGLALARAMGAARRAGAAAIELDFGGQLAWWSRSGSTLAAVLAHPDDRAVALATVALPAGSSLATSGNGERMRLVAGTRRGHLLDPRRGEFAADFGSVAVLAADPGLADAASTALFVLGPAGGPAVARRLGVEACFVVRDAACDGGVRLVVTPGLRDRLATALHVDTTP